MLLGAKRYQNEVNSNVRRRHLSVNASAGFMEASRQVLSRTPVRNALQQLKLCMDGRQEKNVSIELGNLESLESWK